MSDERIRELERAYQDSGGEEEGQAWIEARLRSEISFMDLVKRIWRLEQVILALIPTEALPSVNPSPQEVAAWIDRVNPPPVELCEEHQLPKPCRTCTFKDRVDDAHSVVYMLLSNRDVSPDEQQNVRRVFASTDDVRVYETTNSLGGTSLSHLAPTNEIGVGGYASTFPEGLVVALVLGAITWSAFHTMQELGRPIRVFLVASGRHLQLRADSFGPSGFGSFGSPLLTGPQLRELVPTWKPLSLDPS